MYAIVLFCVILYIRVYAELVVVVFVLLQQGGMALC